MPEVALTEVGGVMPAMSVVDSETSFLVVGVNCYRGEILHVGSPSLVLRHTRSHSETWGEGGSIEYL